MKIESSSVAVEEVVNVMFEAILKHR